MKQFSEHRSRLAFLGAAAGLTDVLAQDTLHQVKTLYASAAYEDALSMATRLQAAGSPAGIRAVSRVLSRGPRSHGGSGRGDRFGRVGESVVRA